MSKKKTASTIKHRGKNYHILQPGERLLRDGSWVDARGKPGKGPCMDPQKAESLTAKKKRAATKKKGA